MNNRISRWLGVASAMLLCMTGCAVNQSKEVAQYRRVLGGEATTAPSGQSLLTLTQALRLANQGNEQLASAGETYLQAIIEKNRAASAFLPTVSLAPRYSVRDNAGGSDRSTSVSGAASANIFNGTRDVASLRQADASERQQRELLLDQQATLFLNVVQTYYQVMQSERQAEVLRRSIAYQQERVRDTESRVRLGVAKPLDLSQSQANLAAARVSLTQANLDARNGRHLLALLIGVSRVEGPLSDDLILGPSLTLDELLRKAQSDRRDLLAAGHAVEAARQAVRGAVGQYYPSVSLDIERLLYQHPSGSSDWSAALSANIPIFSAGRIHADVRTAWSRYRQAVLNEASLRRQIEQEVCDAHASLEAHGRKLTDLGQQTAAAHESLRLAERSYQLGSSSNLDRLVAQDAALSADLQLATEQLAEKVTYLELQRRVGGLGSKMLETR